MTSPCRTLTQTEVRDGHAAQQDMATTLSDQHGRGCIASGLMPAEIATSHLLVRA
jgi:hypothetical protein